MIYHYTTLQTLNNLLNNYNNSNDKRNFIFWASSVYTMNDETEMLYGWDVVLNNLKLYENENSVPIETRLSSYMERIKESSISEIIMQHFYHEEKTPFAISFSEVRDSLTMWHMYGGHGNGVCLCFDEHNLYTKDDRMLLYPLLNVLYINQTVNDEITHSILSHVLTQEYEHYLKSTSKNDLEKIQSIAVILQFLSAYIKHDAYFWEKEKRLVAIARNMEESVHFRVSPKESIIPYVQIPIPCNSLKEIIIGPCLHSDVVQNGLHLHLSVSHLDIPLSCSKIPYREY